MKKYYTAVICALLASTSALANTIVGTWDETSGASYAAEINVFQNGSVIIFDGCQNYVGWVYYVKNKPAFKVNYEEPISCGSTINQYASYVNALLRKPTINFTPANQMIITSGDKALVFTKQNSNKDYWERVASTSFE